MRTQERSKRTATRMTLSWISCVSCVSLLWSSSGCVTPQVSMAEGPREYVATDYESVMRKWTRTEDLFAVSELENYLTATATFESWDFRWAYVVRYVQDYRLTIEQRKKLLEKTLEETRERHHFYVALYGGDRRFNDLTKDNSAWIVRLIDDTGNETAPEEIVSIKRPNALERTYFPYSTVFRQAFRIRFPRASSEGRPTISPRARWFGIRFAGAQGNSELIWNIEDASPKTSPEGVEEPEKPETAPPYDVTAQR